MTSIIDDKLYELITKNENFEFAYDISQRFAEIETRLWKEFWANFKNKLNGLNSNFQFNDFESGFDFYIKKWKKSRYYLAINESNRMEFGVEIDFTGSKKQFQEIRNFLSEEFENDEYIDNKANTLIYYINFNENFELIHNLKKILPENRDKLIEESVLIIERVVERIINEIDAFENGFNK